VSRARSKARRYAVQALYETQFSQDTKPGEIAREFIAIWGLGKADQGYFEELVSEICRQREYLDLQLEPLLDRPLAEQEPVERAILWLGAYELEFRRDIPLAVIISEAVDLAKQFGADQAHTFINAVLDRLAARVRKNEKAERV
jgi:transcription antitermination protein NusB